MKKEEFKNKTLSLPVVVLLSSIIVGGSILYGFSVTQKSKNQQIRKDYVAKQKKDCYSIYEKERDRWNNVKEMQYSEIRDVCIIRYESDEPAKSDEICNGILEASFKIDDERLRAPILDNWEDCVENYFSKIF